MRQRLVSLTAGAVAVSLLAGVLGSAAALAVGGGLIQAGADNDLKCDTNGVNVRYGLSFVSGDFVVSGVTVDGFNNNCIGKSVTVVLTDGGTGVGTATGIVLLSGPSNNRTTGSMTVAPQPLASDVDDVHVLVVDDASP